MEFNDRPKVSVIVATRNRYGSLDRLLQSLRTTQNQREIPWEVLVVDNASTDDTAGYLSAVQREWPHLRTLNEGRPGKNFALNKALREARGEIFCMMDDDIVLDRKWLEGLVRDYQSTGYDALQPCVLPGTDPKGRSADPENLYQYNIPVIDYGDKPRDIRGLTGVIMSMRREVIDKVGLFDERLPASGYEGDTDLSRRIREAGFSIGYTPHVVAYHELDPRRYGIRYARLSQYRKGLSRSLHHTDPIFSNVVPNLLVNILRYGFYWTLRRKEKVYKTEKRIMKYWGYLVGMIQRRLGRQPWV
ncbi:MAG: glycosyltransferase [Deltaproteobacteria bacterium]|nr:glycosyltransferase [Deltaproteobacteria bacterium]